jgi:hypothetical protein
MDATYEVTIQGRLGPALASEFEQLDVVVVPKPPETVLCSPPLDQAGLHGLLRRLEALGLELIDVHRTHAVAGPGSVGNGG